MNTYYFEGSRYPYPQERIFYKATLSVEILTSPDGPEVNEEVEKRVDRESRFKLLQYATDTYGRYARVEDIVLKKVPQFIGKPISPSDEEMWPLHDAVWYNYWRHHRDEFYKTFGRHGSGYSLDTEVPHLYAYIYTAKAVGSIDIGKAKFYGESEEVDLH